MKLFDKFLDSFSARELKTRVWGVVVLGAAICAATAVGGFMFLSSNYTIRVDGTGKFLEGEPKSIEAAFSEKEIQLLRLGAPKYAIISAPGGLRSQTSVEIQNINPENGVVTLIAGTASASPITPIPGRFNLRVVLYEEPYWKFLWGR